MLERESRQENASFGFLVELALPSNDVAEVKVISDILSNAPHYAVACGHIYDVVRHLPCVESFWIHGSRAKGSERAESDLDIALLVNHQDSVDKVKAALQQVLTCDPNFVDYFGDDLCEYWEFQGHEVGVHVYTNEEFYERVASAFSSLSRFESEQSFLQHVLKESVLVFDRNDTLDSLIDVVRDYPESFQREMAEKYLTRLAQKLTWWDKRRSWKGQFEQLSDMSIIVEDICRCHYALNGQMFMPGMKEYPHDLPHLLPDIRDPLREIVLTEAGYGTAKRAAVRTIFHQLLERYTERFSNASCPLSLTIANKENI